MDWNDFGISVDKFGIQFSKICAAQFLKFAKYKSMYLDASMSEKVYKSRRPL
jgi:hypothetical protein